MKNYCFLFFITLISLLLIGCAEEEEGFIHPVPIKQQTQSLDTFAIVKDSVSISPTGEKENWEDLKIN